MRAATLGTCLAAGSATLTLTSPAEAGELSLATQLGADVVVTDHGQPELDGAGFAAALRLGYRLEAPLVRLTPEAKLGFESPGTPNAFAVTGGARLNLLEPLSPAVFAHAGGLVGDMDGFVWDAGLGLDLILPLVDLGVYGAFHQASTNELVFGQIQTGRSSWEWMQFGGQAVVHF